MASAIAARKSWGKVRKAKCWPSPRADSASVSLDVRIAGKILAGSLVSSAMKRRQFLGTSLAALAGTQLPLGAAEADAAGGAVAGGFASRIKLSLKIGMCNFGTNIEDKFSIVQKLGYDGIELNSPGGLNKVECLEAGQKLKFPIHGVVNSLHWRVPFSDEKADVRRRALDGLITGIKEAHYVGGSAVLVVPAVIKPGMDIAAARARSIETISQALPLAAELGIHILMENVWNNFLYDPKGGNSQSADDLAAYIDEYNSPWIGSYFDIGNHQRFGKPADWIRTLGKRIVKLDVKDWAVKGGFTNIGEGDVDWADVRKALQEINYTGWATAEVKGGDEKRAAEVLANMRKHFLGV